MRYEDLERAWADAQEARYLDDQNEMIDDLVLERIEELESMGIEYDPREVELEVINELREKRIEGELWRHGY